MVHTAPGVYPHPGRTARWLIVRHIDVHVDLRSIPRDRRSSHRSGHQYHQCEYSHRLESYAAARAADDAPREHVDPGQREAELRRR